jgi:hypothetical protein
VDYGYYKAVVSQFQRQTGLMMLGLGQKVGCFSNHYSQQQVIRMKTTAPIRPVRKHLVALLLGGLLSAGGITQPTLAAEQPAIVAGTKVRLTPPTNFTPAAKFPGYFQASSNASIMVTEIPGPFSELSAGLRNPSKLEKNGISLLSQEQVKLNGQNAILLKMQQTASGVDFLKWVLIFGDQASSTMVTATFPKHLNAKLSESLKQSLLTSQQDQSLTESTDEGLDYTLQEQGDLKLAKRISNGLLLTKGGAFPSQSAADPIFVVAPSVTEQAIADPEAFSKQRLLKTNSVIKIEIETSQPVTINTLKGYEIVAKAQDQESGQPMLVYQVMLFDQKGYYIMQGLVGEAAKAEYLTAFKAIAQSFQRK